MPTEAARAVRSRPSNCGTWSPRGMHWRSEFEVTPAYPSTKTSTWRSSADLDVALGHEHQALELCDQEAVLVEHTCVNQDGPAVGLGARGLLLQHLGLRVQRVSVK